MRADRIVSIDALGCAEALAALESTTVVELAARRHVAACPQCRHDLEGAPEVVRLFAAAPPPAPPDGLLEDVLAVLAREAQSLRRRVARAAPYVGGVLAATAAGAALAAVSRRGAERPAA